MKFVRFGNIKKTKQKHYGKRDSFHSPPVKEGFYAMPHKAQEFFLIGSISLTQPQLFPKVPYLESAYNKWEHVLDKIPFSVPFEEYPKEYLNDYKKASKKKNKRMRDIRREFVLKNEDEIWHHLGDYMKRNDILQTKGSWVLSRVKEYKKVFDKERYINRYKGNIDGFISRSKDHLEVFIPFNI